MTTYTGRSAMFVLIVLVVACSEKKQGDEVAGVASPGQQLTQTATAGGSASGTSPKALLEDTGRLVDQIVSAAAKLPREEFDPAALAAKLGKDPEAHFAWVRDNTYWAPYRGLLRGSRGVLLDRVGSSLDRAVLLGDLLRRSGYTVRLAQATLPEDRARQLLARLQPIPDKHAVRMDSSPVADEANALVRSQVELLQATTRALAPQSKTENGAAVAALRDHWWVERDDNGKWIAMDVMLPDARAGETLTVATQRSNWNAAEDSPAIPDAEWHAVRIRVVVERYENGNTMEDTALDTVIRPAMALDRPIKFGHLPMEWPEKLPDPKDDPNALGNAAVNVKEWVPYLRIGKKIVAQSAFDPGGNLNKDFLKRKSAVTNLGDRGGSLFGGLDEALSGGAGGATSSLTAEWIDYDILVPGAVNKRFRRPIFDLLGPADRSAKVPDFDANTNERLIKRSEALLGNIDILLQPCNFTPAFVAHLRTASVVESQDAFRKLFKETDPAKARALASSIIARLDIWGPLPILARLRSAIGEQTGDWFVDRPNVLNYRISPAVVNADREAPKEAIDFAANGVGVRQASRESPFNVRMRQGVADTVAEAVALGVQLREAANTASLLAAAGTNANSSRLIFPRHADAARELGWPADVSARLVANVNDGFAVLVPTGSVSLQDGRRTGWWRIDPATGETIGVLDTGLHGVTEDQELRMDLEAEQENLQFQYARYQNHRVDMAMQRHEAFANDPIANAMNQLLQDLNELISSLPPPPPPG